MNVETAELWPSQNLRREDQAIGGNDADIGIQTCELRLNSGVFQRNRRSDGNPQRLCTKVYGRCHQLTATPPAWPRLLTVSRNDIVTSRDQHIQRRYGKLRRAHKNDPHLPFEHAGEESCNPLSTGQWLPPKSTR